MSCNDQKNLLQHSGTSQAQRRLPALQAVYVRPDEHGFPEWIVFASRFSAYLNYYNEANTVTNNWQPFFDNDMAAVLGSVAIQNIDDYRRQIKERLDFLRDDKNEHSQQQLEEMLGSIFSAMLTLGRALDDYVFRLPQTHPWRVALQNVIVQKLQPALKKLLAYYKGGRSNKQSDGTENPVLVLIANKDFPDWVILGRPVRDVLETVNTQNLSPIWLEGAPDLRAFFDSIDADAGIFGSESDAPYKRIQHVASHNLFVSLLDSFLSSYAGLIQQAERSLLDALTRFNAHPPHYALFLAFLQLYRFAQDELNTFTQRHLDFYYQEVLRLSPRKALPNSAFLILELAKGVSHFMLPQGTLFRAGKDSLGKEAFYALHKDTVFNQAKVARLMAVYLGGKTDRVGAISHYGRLFAAPVANSADGLGAAIKTADGAWHPFVGKAFENGVLTAIQMPKAAIGFAVASPYLALAEGDREIQLKLSFAPLAAPLPAELHLEAYLTTAKQWLRVPATVSLLASESGPEDAIAIRIILDGNAPPVTNWDAKVHGGTFRQALPVLRIYLANEETQPYPYNQLKELRLTAVQLSVFAGVDSVTNKASKTGLKQLELSNESGPVDPSRPFQPFGLSPKKGSSLIIGNKEFFKKPGAAFQLKLKWLDLPDRASDVDYEAEAGGEGNLAPKVTVAALSQGDWKPVLTGADLWEQKPFFQLFGPQQLSFLDQFYPEKTFPAGPLSLTAKGTAGAFLNYEAPYGPYTVQRSNGYVKLTLEDGFGYEDYQKAYAQYLVSQARSGSGADPGVPPYVPRLESMSLHYTASTTADLTDASAAAFEQKFIDFYHLYPFGAAEQHAYLSPDTALMLLPQLAQSAGEDSGELYIGLENLQGLQGVSLLFGVQEGTADPLAIKPAKHVNWSYLSGNQWQSFDTQAVSDGTEQLIQTGIVSFSIPEDATTDHTLLPAGYLWLRVSVDRATMAVCKLLSIEAQAAAVSFTDNDNAADFLDLPLPAGTISRLKTPISAIKKILQPYASTGGRPREEKAAYDTRVSERLRHKDRAVTIWDYEHLILEAFPELHRVKCLSHTAYEQLPDGVRRLNELAPGHVTIITVPALQNVSTVNPLRPYTSESTLARIEAFLRERISCHITPHVVHPLFEEVALDCKLRLMPGYEDVAFYIRTLKEEVTAFLTPWAFGQSREVSFGGKISKSTLINFIEERPYVDYITDVKMYHLTEATPNATQDTEEITASSGMAILVSVPAARHKIEPLPAPPATPVAALCLDPANAQKPTSTSKP